GRRPRRHHRRRRHPRLVHHLPSPLPAHPAPGPTVPRRRRPAAGGRVGDPGGRRLGPVTSGPGAPRCCDAERLGTKEHAVNDRAGPRTHRHHPHAHRARRRPLGVGAAALVLTAASAALFSLAGPVSLAGAASAQTAPPTQTGQAAQVGGRSVPAVTSPCTATAADETAWVECTLSHMTVAQKVGQMFVVNGFGATATDSTPIDVGANQAIYGPGVSTIGDIVDTYDPGGFIYFAWSNGLTDPTTVAEL